MIKVKNNYYRNLEEQVQFLTEYHNVNQGLVQWGIKVVGQVETSRDLPVPYDGEFGDAIAVGSKAPFFFYIWTRASIEGEPAYWFPFGEISIVGPEGPKGDKGEQGIPGPSSMWYSGVGAPTTTIGYKDGDMYLATNGQVYRFENNAWSSVANIKGSQGIQGIQGPKGDRGAQGPQGPKGDTGDVGGFINIAGIINDFDEYGNPILPIPSELGDLSKAYLVGASTPYDLYIQVGSTSTTATWNNAGPFNAATLVTENGVGLNVFDADTKVDKYTTSSDAQRAYVVLQNGTQGLKRMVFGTAEPDSIALRNNNGQVVVETPTSDQHAATKKYVDDGVNAKLDKITEAGNGDNVYGINNSGSQVLYKIARSPIANTLPLRDTGGQVYTKTPIYDEHATNKKYVDDGFVAKVNGTGAVDKVYVAASDGTQKVVQIISSGTLLGNTVAGRRSNGAVQTVTPELDDDATTKKYVDTKITGIFSLDGTTLTITTT